MNIKHTLLATALSGAVVLAGCTAADVVSNITNVCTALGSGLSIAALISGQVAGGAAISTTVSSLIGNVTNDCPQFAAAASSAVTAITSLGQTAAVSVAANATTASSLRRLGAPSRVFNFTVSPSGAVTPSAATAAMLKKLGG